MIFNFFFLEKMEATVEKISQITHKNELNELYLVGEKIHEVINHCNQNCVCLQYLSDLKHLIEVIDTGAIPLNQRIIFEKKPLDNLSSFLLYDQRNKEFGDETFMTDISILKLAIKFEVDKIKRFLKAIETAEKLDGYIYVFSKSFI